MAFNVFMPNLQNIFFENYFLPRGTIIINIFFENYFLPLGQKRMHRVLTLLFSYSLDPN